MTGTWLPRTGLLCFLAGIVLLMLACVGLVISKWVWSPFVSAIALLLAAQILFALSDILHRLLSLEETVRGMKRSDESEPGVGR